MNDKTEIYERARSNFLAMIPGLEVMEIKIDHHKIDVDRASRKLIEIASIPTSSCWGKSEASARWYWVDENLRLLGLADEYYLSLCERLPWAKIKVVEQYEWLHQIFSTPRVSLFEGHGGRSFLPIDLMITSADQNHFLGFSDEPEGRYLAFHWRAEDI